MAEWTKSLTNVNSGFSWKCLGIWQYIKRGRRLAPLYAIATHLPTDCNECCTITKLVYHNGHTISRDYYILYSEEVSCEISIANIYFNSRRISSIFSLIFDICKILIWMIQEQFQVTFHHNNEHRTIDLGACVLLMRAGIMPGLSLQWRHNGHENVSNYRRLDCLLSRLFRRKSKKTSKLCVTGLCEGNSPVIGEFPAQRANNAENVSIWWRHHGEIRTTTTVIPFK